MNDTEKRGLITAIRDEVKALHPLLNGIFGQMPGIVGHEYTHGPKERGADFILEKEDPGTGRRSYVGVVAKATKITGDVSDIEEQIRECEEERFYKGTIKVRCPEVWVMCSGGITERAKEKVSERFREKVIHFFDTNDLLKFVDKHSPHFWESLPPAIGTYLANLSARLTSLDHTSSVSLLEFGETPYIELDTFERQARGYQHTSARRKQPTTTVNLFSEARHIRIGVLEAEMGFGKSRLVRQIARHYCSPKSFNETKLVPIFGSLRDLVIKHSTSVKELLDSELGMVSGHLQENPEHERLLFLDGLDEIPTSGKPPGEVFESIIRQIRELGNVRLLVTTRPIRTVVERIDSYQDVRQFGIRPLSLKKIVAYIQLACTKAQLPVRMYEDLKRSPLFRQLPQSQIAAALFSNLLNQNPQDVPQTLTELYSKSIELMLGRWDQKKGSATEKEFTTAQLIAQELSDYFVTNGLSTIAIGEAKARVATYLNSRQTGVDEARVIDILFDRSNIFSVDIDQGTVSFRHRSFAEFLFARRKINDPGWQPLNHAFDPLWANVVFFYSGLRLDCSEFLTELQRYSPGNIGESLMKIVHVPKYTLAAYQTEFRVIESNTHLILLDAAHLYDRIARGEIKTSLNELSEMSLLYLFKSVLSESLGYSFFRKAIDPICVHVQEADVDTRTKVCALFFLGCIGAQFDDESAFQFLIKCHPIGELPISISVALTCETRMHTNLEKSPLLRAHADRLRKVLAPTSAKDPALMQKRLMKELFEMPIRTRIAAA